MLRCVRPDKVVPAVQVSTVNVCVLFLVVMDFWLVFITLMVHGTMIIDVVMMKMMVLVRIIRVKFN